VSDQLTLLDDDAPYYLNHRDYCDVWEVRRKDPRGGTGWELKQFRSRAHAVEGLRWLLEDHRQTGVVRTRYPVEAPWSMERPGR
jgi:hypothetical protein